jgi:hypothetical protein
VLGPQLLDELLPVYDVSDGVAVVVDADVTTTWAALLATDLIEVGKRRPLVGLLGGIRALPEIVSKVFRGKPLTKPPEHLTLPDTTSLPMDGGGWVLLGERPTEIALGLVGAFWRPVIRFADVADAGAFRSFSKPGYAKTLYALSADELEPGKTQLTAVMRTSTTDGRARRWFWRYWTLGVGSGAHVLAHGLLEAARASAERGVGG